MEKDYELEKLFNEWKIEEAENLQYIDKKNREFQQNIEKTRKIMKFMSFVKYAKYIRIIMTLLYAISLKYIIFNNKEQDPYILIVYHYIMFISMVYSRLLYSNIKIKLLSSLLKKMK